MPWGKALQGIPGEKSRHYGVSRRKQGRERGATVAPFFDPVKNSSTGSPKSSGMTPMAESLWWVMQQMCLPTEQENHP